MATNRKRRSRLPKKKIIPIDITEEYLESLRCRDYMTDPEIHNGWESDVLSKAENDLLAEYLKADRDYGKWQKTHQNG